MRLTMLLLCAPLVGVQGQAGPIVRSEFRAEWQILTHASPQLQASGYRYAKRKSYGAWGHARSRSGDLAWTAGAHYGQKLFQLGGSVGLLATSEVTAAGGEGAALRPRFGLTARVGDVRKLSLGGYYESGSSLSEWCRADLNWVLHKRFIVGGMHQCEDGYGPKLVMVERTLENESADWRLTLAPLYGRDETKYFIGVELHFVFLNP